MTIITKIIDTVITHAKLTLAVILLITVFFTYWFAQQAHNNHIEIFFEDDDPLFVAYQKFQDTYGNEEYGIIALESDSLFSNEKIKKIRELTAALKQIDGVERVLSLTNIEEFYGEEDYVELRNIIPPGDLSKKQLTAVQNRAVSHKFVTDHLISKDGRMTALHVELASMDEKAKRNTVAEMIRISNETVSNEFTVYCSGSSLVEVELNRLSERDFLIFIPIIIALLFIFIMILLRQVTIAVLCQINMMVILIWGLGLYVLCGEKFNIITDVMGAVLLAIAIADSVHILSHLKETCQNTDLEPIPAIRHTIRQVWFPCLFTSLTTGAGFLSFYTSDIRPVAILGLFTAIGVMFAFILSVSTLPAMMLVIRKKIAASFKKFKIQKKPSGHTDVFTRALVRIGVFSTQQKTALFITFIFILCVTIAGITRIKFETNTFHYLPDANRIKTNLTIIENHFGGTIPFIVVIKSLTGTDFSDPKAVKMIETFENKFLTENEGLTSVFSIVEYIKEFNQAFNNNDTAYHSIPDSRLDIADAFELGDPEVLDRIISPDHREICITFNTIWDSNKSGYKLHEDVLSYLEKTIGKAYAFHITGISSLYLAMNKHLQETQIKSFFIAFTVIFLMMIFVCRNLWLAALCMIPNLFPIAITLGIMGWFGIPLDVATTMIASVTIGIAVDDTIHFVSWLRRNSGTTNDVAAAIVQTFADVGKPIVITTVLLSSGFFVLVFGSIVPTKIFGVLTAISMVFALIGDFFVLPALILILKPKLPPLAGNSPVEGKGL